MEEQANTKINFQDLKKKFESRNKTPEDIPLTSIRTEKEGQLNKSTVNTVVKNQQLEIQTENIYEEIEILNDSESSSFDLEEEISKEDVEKTDINLLFGRIKSVGTSLWSRISGISKSNKPPVKVEEEEITFLGSMKVISLEEAQIRKKRKSQNEVRYDPKKDEKESIKIEMNHNSNKNLNSYSIEDRIFDAIPLYIGYLSYILAPIICTTYIFIPTINIKLYLKCIFYLLICCISLGELFFIIKHKNMYYYILSGIKLCILISFVIYFWAVEAIIPQFTVFLIHSHLYYSLIIIFTILEFLDRNNIAVRFIILILISDTIGALIYFCYVYMKKTIGFYLISIFLHLLFLFKIKDTHRKCYFILSMLYFIIFIWFIDFTVMNIIFINHLF